MAPSSSTPDGQQQCDNNVSPTMSSEAPQRPSPYDFATLYEEWYLLQRSSVGGNGGQTSIQNDGSQNLAYAAALASRAGRMGNIQSAILSNGHDPSEHSGYLRGLLEIMQVDDEKELPLPIKLENHHQAAPANISSVQQQLLNVDLDAFFDEYPECRRPEAKVDYQYYDDSESESSDDGEGTSSTRRKKRALSTESTSLLPSKEAQNQPKPMAEEREIHTAQNDEMKPPNPQPERINNPYRQLQNNRNDNSNLTRSHSLPQTFHQQPAIENAHYSEHPNAQQQMREFTGTTASLSTASHPGTWENQQQQQQQGQNPFQTAKEFAKTLPPPPPKRQPQQSHFAYDINGYSQNIMTQQQDMEPAQETTAESPLVQAPMIRDSLKRKFQPPKVGANPPPPSREPSKGGGNNNRGRKDVAQKISGKVVQGGGTSNKQSDNNDDEEDDLPEELKRFGKDLVEKIQDEIMDCGDPIKFSDIAGLEDAKATIQEIVCWPMQRPDLFTGLRKTPNGLLLFGPPGTGKTLIGKAIAHESGATFFSISSSSLTSKWIGEGEKLVRTMFAVAAYHEPSVVFVDEIDSLLTQRKADDNESSRRIKTEFLVQLDGTGTSGQGRLLCIGATNRPQELDEAARRRFVKRLYIPLPNESDRACLLRVLLEKNRHTISEKEIVKLAGNTKGFSGADLKSLSADAAMGPIRQLGPNALDIALDALPPISYKHFRQSLRGMHASVSPEDVVQYEVFDQTYGSKRASKLEEDDDETEDEEE